MNKGIGSGVLLLIAAAALCPGGCASRKKGGTAVIVVSEPGAVRGCAFVGRVTQTVTENEPVGVGMLRQRTAEAGGNTLLMLPGGVGEAWNCADRLRVFAPDAKVTASRPVTGSYPTPPATPRY
jgi:hypothetical protein